MFGRCAFTERRDRLLAIPSIDLEGGLAVKRVKGVRGTGLVLGDPFSYAERLYNYGFRVFHVVDLDGAEKGRPIREHLEAAKQITEDLGVCIQYGGGLRRLSYIEEVCSTGATPVVGSAWLSDPGILDEAYRVCGKVIAAVDHFRGAIVYNAWRSSSMMNLVDAIQLLERRRVTAYLMTSVASEGTLAGPDIESLTAARSVTGRPIEYSGGISSLSDLASLAKAGADAAILGMALAKGLLDAREVASRYG